MRPQLVSLRFTLFSFALLVTAAVDAGVAHAAGTPVNLWGFRFGTTSTEIGNSVATDVAGNIIVVGSFTGSTNFGGATLVSPGATDGFIAKYNSSGAHLWSVQLGYPTDGTLNGVACDASGSIYVTGSVTVSPFASAVFIAKYSSAGSQVWKFDANPGFSPHVGRSVAVDPMGYVYATGEFQGSIAFGPLLTSAGQADIYLVKFDPSGNHVASARFGSTGQDAGQDVALDASNNVVMVGNFANTVDFGNGPHVSAGAGDIFMARYTSSLTPVWSRSFGGSSADVGRSVAIASTGEVCLAGTYASGVDFGGGVLPGVQDAFLARFTSSGTHLWSRGFGGMNDDYAFSVAVDSRGRPTITGDFLGVADFGGGAMTSAGRDMFIAKYSTAGKHLWSQRFGVTGATIGNGVAIDASNNVVVSGTFTGTTNLGGGNLSTAGGNDMFLARYAGPALQPLITSIVDIGNDQGRLLKIRFDRSAHDGVASSTVTRYEAYRRDAAPPGVTTFRDPAGLSPARLRADGWTEVATADAHAENTYGIDVPTIGDSTITLGQYWSSFYVRAATATTATYYDSPADSGYSLDNLAPGVPLNFVYSAGNLAWDESAAADFDYFTVYGSNVDGFGSAVVVDYSVAPAMDVTASPYTFYYVTATDFSGNEGKPAKVNTLSGAGGTPRSYVLSVANFPNPFNPRTTVRYTVPSRGRVTIAVYDARGSHVATLFDGERSAGAYSIDWDGRGANGAVVGSGVYFARIEQGGVTRSKKMMLLK